MNFRSILNLVLAAIPSALLLSTCSQAQQRPLPEEILFQTVAPNTVPYRIPAMGQLPDGSIVALSDYRPCGMDIGFGQVDIHGRISDQDGSKWGEEFVLVEGTGVPATTDCGFGDPAMVVDRETGEVLVVMVCGNTIYY